MGLLSANNHDVPVSNKIRFGERVFGDPERLRTRVRHTALCYLKYRIICLKLESISYALLFLIFIAQFQ